MLATAANTSTRAVLVIGKESVGKSQLVSALTGSSAGENNFRGSTVTVQRYRRGTTDYIDTPGILRKSDTETTRLALAELNRNDVVLLVVQATHFDEDLRDMLPLVVGKRGAVAVTFWDKVQPGEAACEAVERLATDAGVALIPVNARRLLDHDRQQLEAALLESPMFTKPQLTAQAGWRIEPRPSWLENRVAGPLLAVVLLILPALATIYGANRLADALHPIVARGIEPWIATVNTTWPAWMRLILTAQHGEFGYGLLNMGPFLFVWALPTVILFSLILGAYKASGLVERINVAIHPWARPFGLSGRDVVRVMMGFGCNVPAVISTRSCSSCSRGPAIAAISFGAACSYQLPATLAVLAASAKATGASRMGMTLLFLGYLLATTLVYLRLTTGADARSSLNILLTPRRPFMQWPTAATLGREALGTLRQFFGQALPIFSIICVAAALLAECGALDAAGAMLAPVMRVFRLPSDAALPIVLASIRKDGIFLFAAEHGLTTPLTPSQTLTAVYLAGVLLPCLVTALTIGRETSWWETITMLMRQALFAIFFSVGLAWIAGWLL